MTTKRLAYVDGSNIAYPKPAEAGGRGQGVPRVANLLAVRDVLVGWGATPIILADSTLPRVIDDPPGLSALINGGDVRLVEDRPIADLELLECAERDRAPILSHDGFDDHQKHYPWAWSCVVDCLVRDGVVLLEGPKLAALLGTQQPPQGDVGRGRWSRIRPTFRHRGGVELALNWLRCPATPPAPEPRNPVELQFPNKFSMGWLYRRTDGEMWNQHVWKLARGIVRGERGEWLGLEVRGRGVCNLAGLRELPGDGLSEVWWAGSALVDDNQLLHLAYLSELKELSLYGQPITDQGLRRIADLSYLEVLDIASTRWAHWGPVTRRSPNPVGDEGILHLTSLRRLRHLGLRGSSLTLLGILYLTILDNLESLDLSDTPFSDAHARELKRIQGLTTLFLRNTPITDAATEHLACLPNLRYLDVTGTQMSSAWQSALPAVRPVGNLRPGDPLILPRLDLVRTATGAVPLR